MADREQDGTEDAEFTDDADTKDEGKVSAMGETADRQRSLDDLKVEATLRIGVATVPLKTILGIKVGQVIPLDRPLAGPVQVIVGGRTVASGELVAVHGFYAIKIKDVSVLERHLPVFAG